MSLESARKNENRYRNQFFELVQETWLGYALILPATLLLCIVIFYPTIQAIWTGFFERSFLNPAEMQWIGLSNYFTAFQNPEFWHAFQNSVVLTGVAVALEYLIGLGVALVLKRKLPGIKFFQRVTMLSWALPVIVTVIIFNFLVQYPFGLVNQVFAQFGLPTGYWFGQTGPAFALIIAMHIWRNSPFFAISLMASMQSIPESLYEAAEMDGASPLYQFKYITLPNISYMSMIMIIVNGVWTFNNFSFVYLSTGGGPYGSTEVLATYVYKQAFQSYALGYAAAIGVVMLLVMLTFTIIYVNLEARE